MNEFVVTLNEKKKNVSVSGNSKIWIDGKEYECELIHLNSSTYLLKLNNQVFEITADSNEQHKFSILIEGEHFEAVIRTSLQEKANKLLEQKFSVHHKTEVKAPMPGMILKIKKKSGEKIIQGETVMILEAMKMENDLRAVQSGEIKELFVKEGTAVEKGAPLFIIE